MNNPFKNLFSKPIPAPVITTAKPRMGRSEQHVLNSLTNLALGLTEEKSKVLRGQFADITLDVTELEALYKREVAGKIIDVPIDDALKKWREFENLETEQEVVLTAAEEKFKVHNILKIALKKADLYGGAAIFKIVNDGLDQSLPLDPAKVRQDSLVKLKVYPKDKCKPDTDTVSKDIASPYFDEPEIYLVGTDQVRTHRSRLTLIMGAESIVERTGADAYWGESRLQRPFDSAKRLESFVDNVAEMAYETKLDVISVRDLAGMLGRPGGAEEVMTRFSLMNTLKSVCNMTLLDQDESYAQKQLSFSGLDSIIQLYMLLFSGVADIPATRLWGQAASGLNATGEGDQLNYDSRVEADRAGRITDALRDLDTVLIPSALGSIPEGYSWYWPPLQDADDTAETAREKTDAETDVMLIKSGVVTADQAAARVLNTKRYPTMDQAYVDTLRSALEETPSTDEPDGTV